MSRMVEIELEGRKWPLCLTLSVFGDICDRYGGMKECMERLDKVAGLYEKNEETGELAVLIPEDTQGLIEEYVFLLETLLEGGWQRISSVKGAAEAGPAPLKEYEIMAVVSPGDIPMVQRKVLEAIRLGQSREVGADAPKNEKGPAGR